MKTVGRYHVLANPIAPALADPFDASLDEEFPMTPDTPAKQVREMTYAILPDRMPPIPEAQLTDAQRAAVADIFKEITDALNEKQVRDMTKSQLVKGAFRMLTLKLGQAKIPMIVTNHTYDVIGAYVPTKEMGGGSGLKYASSTIVYLSKKKEKDGTDVVGNIIKAKTAKSRLSKENKVVEIRLFYDERGLDKYYGLLELGELGGLWKNVAGRYEINGKKLYAKEIFKDPEKYFTAEVMQALDETAQKEFSYG